VPDGAAYLARTFACEAGSRDYKIYVPNCKTRRKRPLIVMLHGCTQNPDDFAIGTGINWLAEEYGLSPLSGTGGKSQSILMLELVQARGPAARHRGAQHHRRDYTHHYDGVRDRFQAVYVAGLSAGGAMAAIMSATYPELYAATAIHSGLAYGSASDMASAFAAMRGGSRPVAPAQGKRHHKSTNGHGRTIVFHGAADQTVHPSNAEVILADARAGLTGPPRETQQEGSAEAALTSAP